MPIIDATNLFGDSLYSLLPIAKSLETNSAAIVHDRNPLVHDLFYGSFRDHPSALLYDSLTRAKQIYPQAEVISLSAGTAAQLSVADRTKPQLNIAEAYAKILGVEVDISNGPLTTWKSSPNPSLPKCIVLAPFSKSCTFHSQGVRNKTLPDPFWEVFINYLEHQGLPIYVLGGPQDKLHCSIPIDRYITAESLQELESVLHSAQFLLSIDNGVNHIAAALDVPTICFWPKASSHHFIAPLYAKRSGYILIEPTQVTPAAILNGLRRFTRIMMDEEYEKIVPSETPQTNQKA